MPDYKTMYFKMSARVADAIELLIQAQRDGEEAFLEDELIAEDGTLLEEESIDDK